MRKKHREKVAIAIKRVLKGENLNKNELVEIFKIILDHELGVANDVSFGALFAALQTKGPTKDEMLALIEVVLNYDRIEIPYLGDANELCGIVGSGKGDLKTFNVSSCAAFVAAGAGVKIVKNGSRSESSIAGTTDVLECLGININLKPKKIIEALNEHGITFCDAEPYFPRMAKEYIGKFLFPHPLSYTLSIASGLNFGRILFGFSLPETEKVAEILISLGYKHFMVVSGQDMKGSVFDEISNIGPTKISEFKNNKLKTYITHPRDFGFKVANYKYIKEGKTVQENAKIILKILKNEDVSPARDIVLMNAGALIYLADQVNNIKDGVKKATGSLESGKAYRKFEKLKNHK